MNEPLTIEVQTKLFGLGAERSASPVFLALQERRLTVRALLEEHVRTEVLRAQTNRHSSLALHYLLCDTLHQTPNPPVIQNLELESEIERACTALSEGRYLLLIDGETYQELDLLVSIHEQSKVSFVRLLPLVGG